MVVLKSIFAGLVAVIALLLLAAMGVLTWGWWTAHRLAQSEGVGAVAYEVNTAWIMIPVPLIVGVVFFGGLYWEYRRATRANRAPR